jgi:hypothetical protein
MIRDARIQILLEEYFDANRGNKEYISDIYEYISSKQFVQDLATYDYETLRSALGAYAQEALRLGRLREAQELAGSDNPTVKRTGMVEKTVDQLTMEASIAMSLSHSIRELLQYFGRCIHHYVTCIFILWKCNNISN